MRSEFAESRARGALDEQPSGTDAPDLLVRGVARSLAWVGLAIVLGGTLGFAFGLLQPDRFASTTKLMLRSGAREQLTSESLVGLEGEHLASPPTMHDEIEMLSDPAILEQIASRLGPEAILDRQESAAEGARSFAPLRWLRQLQTRCAVWFAGGRGSASEGNEDRLRLAARVLKQDTQIENEPGSNVIVVTHTSSSPAQARAVAQALAEAFIARHREQFSIQSLVETSRVKLAQARAVRDAAANEYLESVNRSEYPDLGPQVPALEAEIAALGTELFDAKVRKQAIGKQRAKLSGRLEDLPTEVEVTGPVVMVPNEEYETQLMLKRELLAKKQQVALENRTIAETARLTKLFDQQIAAADQKLQQLPKVVAQNPGLRENLAHSALSNRVEDLDLEEQGLNVKLEALEQRLTEKRAQAAEIRKQVLGETLRQKDFESKREAEESTYKQALARFSVLEALGKIEQQEEPNLRVLQAATLELDPTGPRRISLVLKGLFGGLLVGVAFAVLRQRLDRRLQRPESVERVHSIPVLGIVPDVSALHPSWTRSLTGWSSRP